MAAGEDWKKIAGERLKDLEELQESYDEFEATSKEVEQELEADLAAANNSLRGSQAEVFRIQRENEDLKKQRDSNRMEIDRFQKNIEEIRCKHDGLEKERRRLEQDNDDLQRGRRVDEATIEKLRSDLEQTEEDLIIQREEMNESKERLEENIQRLRDEYRDASLEIEVLKNKCAGMHASAATSSSATDILLSEHRATCLSSMGTLKKQWSSFRSNVISSLSKDQKCLRVDVARIVELVKTKVGSSPRNATPHVDMSKKINGNIRVLVRIRPPIPNMTLTESKRLSKSTISMMSVTPLAKNGLEVRRWDDSTGLRSSEGKPFSFDAVLPPETTQNTTFEEVKDVADLLLSGINGCLLAYGQTGSGKTHTIEGINRRMVSRICCLANARSKRGEGIVSVELGVVEIYNETIRDLLCDACVREVKGSGCGPSSSVLHSEDVPMSSAWSLSIQIPGLKWKKVNNVGDAVAALSVAKRTRATGATDANERSSRSHAVYMYKVSVSSRPDDLGSSSMQSAMLSLVDLAGSERLKKSKAMGTRKKETEHINRSLSALGDVMHALDMKHGRRRATTSGKKRSKGVHIPYRNSKLTFLLRDALGGNTSTTLIATVCSDNSSTVESLSTLEFATRCRSLDLEDVRKNVRERNVAARLKREVEKLRICNEKLRVAHKAGKVTLGAALLSKQDVQRSKEETDRTLRKMRERLETLEGRLADSTKSAESLRAQLKAQGERAKKAEFNLRDSKSRCRDKLKEKQEEAERTIRGLKEELEKQTRFAVEVKRDEQKRETQMRKLRTTVRGLREEKCKSDEVLFHTEVRVRATRARRDSSSSALPGAQRTSKKRALSRTLGSASRISTAGLEDAADGHRSRIPQPSNSLARRDLSAPMSSTGNGHGASRHPNASRFGFRPASKRSSNAKKPLRWR
eukprot:g934.t1